MVLNCLFYRLLPSINLFRLYGEESVCNTQIEDGMLIAVRELLMGTWGPFSPAAVWLSCLKSLTALWGWWLLPPALWDFTQDSCWAETTG